MVQRVQGKGYDEGCIIKKVCNYSYFVDVKGKFHRRHADQLRVRDSEHEHSEMPLNEQH